MACTISRTGFEHPEVSMLLRQLNQHPAWRDSFAEEEIEVRLLKSSYYSFFLTAAEQEGLYYISFLDRDDTVHRHIFRIVPDRGGKMGYKNGTLGVYQDIDDLVSASIGCAPSAVSPCE